MIKKLIIFFVFFILLNLNSILIKAETFKKVFIIHSYSLSNITSVPQHAGIVEVLRSSGIPMDIKVFYMQTKTKYITPEAIKKRANMAINMIKNYKPDVVIVVDDNACRDVMLRLVDSSYKFVFTGMNMPPEEYNKKIRFMESRERPGHNITGVFERLYVATSIGFISQVVPTIKRCFIFVSTSPTGIATKKSILYELNKRNLNIPVDIFTVHTLKQYVNKLNWINESFSREHVIIIPVLDRLVSERGIMTLKEIVEFTVANSRVLDIGSGPTLNAIKLGLFGGTGVDFKVMGRQAAEKAVMILKGKSPKNIPIEDSKGYNIVINLKRARELGIKLPFELYLSSNIIIGGDPVE